MHECLLTLELVSGAFGKGGALPSAPCPGNAVPCGTWQGWGSSGTRSLCFSAAGEVCSPLRGKEARNPALKLLWLSNSGLTRASDEELCPF